MAKGLAALGRFALGMSSTFRPNGDQSIDARACRSGTFRTLSALAAGICLAPAQVAAAPSDCMGSAADGLALCTSPRISPFSYSACSTTLIGVALNMEDACYAATVGVGNPINTEGKLAAFMGCVRGNGPQNPPNIPTFSWEPPGSSFYSYNCASYQVVMKYGQEMRGYDIVGGHPWAGDGFYAYRGKTATCPTGYSAGATDANGFPEVCVRTPKLACDRVGNPMGIANAEKELNEFDLQRAPSSPLSFQRWYSSQGWYRPLNAGSSAMRGFGDFWRHTYDRRVYDEASQYLLGSAIRPNGITKHFRPDGTEVLRQAGAGDRLAKLTDGSGNISGWEYRSDSGIERYDASGALTVIYHRDGAVETMTYSDASTPVVVAPHPGLLLRVTDHLGRALHFTYDGLGRLSTMTDLDGQVYQYTFDGNEMLVQVTFPDGKNRQYRYNDNPLWAQNGGPYAMTGLIDELGVRTATYGYRDGYWNTPDYTEHAGGTNRYSRMVSGNTVQVIDPLGQTRNYTLGTVAGVPRIVSQSQPAGSGCAASASQLAYDASGNVASTDDFNGSRTCFASDPTRNVETTRVEGLPTTQDCAAVTPSGVALPAGSRKISTQWHPDWRLQTKVAEPGRFVTSVYNGRPDPFAGNATASCAPTTALLPDGTPIPVLCKQVEQATTDSDGHLGMSATLQSGVANRVRSFTYNAYGQLLTAKDPRNNTTTYAYYTDTSADHTAGDLQTITNAKLQVTTFGKYNKHGQVLESTDANGVLTVNTYDLRQRLLGTSVGGQTTSFSYDAAGQLTRVTQPDSSYLGFEYDAAHRQTAVFDSRGNRIDYTLDNMGNRTGEVVRDPLGSLARSASRAFDALGRTQQVTGSAQ